MGAYAGRRLLDLGLAAVLAVSTTGLPMAVTASDDEASESLRELQAELNALFAPDPTSQVGDPIDVVGARFAPEEIADAPLGAGPAAGPAGSAVVVSAVALVEDNATVTLEWDDVLGVGGFEVLRDGVVVGESEGTEPFVDTVAGDSEYEYEIRAIDPGLDDPSVGATTVVVPDANRSCDFSWTGAADSVFANDDNWAPIDGTPAVPNDGDHVCIDSRQNTPVTSDAAGARVGTATTTLKADDALPALLEIADGDFTVSTSFAEIDLLVSGGSFASVGNTTFRLLTVTDGELALTGFVEAPEGVQFGPGSPVISSTDGDQVTFDVSPRQASVVIGAALNDAALTLDGPVRFGRFGDLVKMTGTSSVVPATEGATVESSFLVAESGVAQVEVSMSSTIRVDEGAALTVTDHQAFANGTVPPQIVVSGTLTLTQPITQLGNLDFRTSTAKLELNGGPANDFAGLVSINDMTVDRALDIVVRNDLQVRSLSMNNGATFTVEGEFDYTSFLVLSGATITAPTVVTSGPNSFDGDIDVFGTQNRIVGDVTTGGTIRLNSNPEVSEDARLAIDGDLTLGSDSFIDTSLTGSDVTGRLAIRDTATLDGALLVRVNGVIPADTDIAAISWGSAIGTIDRGITGNVFDTTIEQRAGGVFVRRAGGGLDITRIAALGLFVDVELGLELQLGWPVVLDTDRYRILQDGNEINETTETNSAVDLFDFEPGDQVTFQVIALGIEEDETNLGSLTIVLPKSDCSIAWTGAIDDQWSNPLNWLPTSEEEMPSPRVPAASDDVCIDIETNTPIVIAGDVSVETIASTLPVGATPLIDVQSGDVAVGTSIAVPSLQVIAGSVTTPSLVVDSLTLGNAVVDATVSDIGGLGVQASGEEGTDAELFGATAIDLVVQSADTTLRIEELVSPGATVLDLAGSTTIDKEVAALAELYLFEDATLTLGGGTVNALNGLTQIGVLGLQDTAIGLPANVTIGDLLIADTEVDGIGDLTITGRLGLQDGATFDLDGDVNLGPDAEVAVTSVRELAQMTIVGTANLDGRLDVTVAETVTELPFIEWAASTGSFDATSLTGAGADGRELIVGATGVSIEPVFSGPQALSVLGFDVGDGLGNVDILLAWPEFDGAESYAVLQNGELAVEATSLIAQVTTDAKQTDTWSVVALDRGGREIGEVGSLDVLAAVNVCDVVWTGAISDEWGDPLNWAPVTSDGALPLQTVPGALDLVCVHVDENLPISVTSDVDTGAVFSFVASNDRIGLADDVVALDVSGAEFSTIEGITTAGVAVRGGTLDLADVTDVAGDLALDGATIELAGDMVVEGAIRVSGTANVLDADPQAPIFVGAELLAVTDTNLVIDADITFDANRVELDGGIVGGAARFTTSELVAVAGDNGVGGAAMLLDAVTVDAGARLVTDKIGGVADTVFTVRGRLDLLAPGAALGGLTLEGPGAEVAVDDGDVNVLVGITSIEELIIDDAQLEVTGALAARDVDLRSAQLTVEDRLDTAWIFSVGTSRIETPVVALADPDGVGLSRMITGTPVPDSALTITGDLILGADSGISLELDAIPDSPLVQVEGGVSLDGELSVTLDVPFPAGTERSLVTWADASGSWTNRLLGANADDAVLSTTPTGALLRSAVPIVPELVAYGIEVGEREEDPSTISLTWPMLDGATSYEIAYADTVVTTTATSASVSVPSTEPARFTVVGIDDDKPLDEVGTLSVFGSFTGCDVAWTGAIDSDWNELFNWAPVAFDGDPLPPMRAPAVDDIACVAVDTNLPIQIGTDTTVGSLLTIVDDIVPAGLAPTVEVIAVDLADFTATSVALITSATVTDGTLRAGAGTIYGDLVLDNATFEFAASAFDIRGTLTSTGPGDQVVATAADTAALTIDEVVVDTADLEFVGGIEPVIERVELRDGFLQGGTSTTITTLVAPSGTSTVALADLRVDAVSPAAPATLNFPSPARFSDTAFAVLGRVNLPAGVDSIGALELSATGAITIGGGRDNVLTGVISVGDLSIFDNTLATDGPLTAPLILLDDAELNVTGTLGTSNLASFGTSRINATTTTLAGNADVEPVLSSGNSEKPSTLTIAGDLVLPNDGLVNLSLDALPTAPLVTVTGDATLGGDALVSVVEVPGKDVEVDLVRWTTSTGTLATTLLGDDAGAAELRLRDAGLFLASAEIQECGDAPRFADMNVEGCWVEEADGTVTATRVDNVDGVTIGGVDLVILDDQTTIVLDPAQNQIFTTGADGEPLPVAVSVPVSEGDQVRATIPLGTFAFDGFDIGTSISFPLDEFFGIDVAGTPRLVSRTGGWDFRLDLDLSGILSTLGSLDLSVGEFGISAADLSFDDLSAVFGQLAGILDLDIDWLDASTWSFSSGDLGGPSVTGDVDFTELDGGGTLSVRDLRVDDVLVLPDFDLTGVFTDTARTWTVEQPAPSRLRSLGFSYTPEGAPVSASILLGDEIGEALRASVATWGEWLDIDTFELAWSDAAKQWDINGRLSSPEVAFAGVYVGDDDGGTERFDLNITGAELGPFATLALDLSFDGTGDDDVYTATTVITRDAAPDINGGGVFTFVDGDLDTASLTFESIEIGELVTIDDFTFRYVREEGHFRLGGDLVGPDGADNAVSGSLTFEDGKLREGELRLDSLELGPVRFDELAFDFARTVGDERITIATISGSVQVGSRPARPVTGAIEFVDGELTLLDVQVGTIDLGGIAQIEDVRFGYTANADGTATVGGSGRLVTSDGATDSPVLVELTLQDGRVVDGRIEADVLSFGRALTIENFTLTNSPVTPGTCSAFAAPDGAQQWQVTGETTSNGETTSIDGCLVLDGARLVAGDLELGNVRLGGLITIENLRATFEQSASEEVTGPDGDKIFISRTDMSLSATARVGEGAAKSFRGSASFANGGLLALDLSLPDLDLMNVVKLRGVEFSYIGATPWDGQVDTTFSLSGSVVGENTTSSFAGDVVFGEDGEVQTLSIDAEDIDFGVFRIDVLSFSYDAQGDETVWAVSGEVDVDGETSSITGFASFEDGRIIEAELALEQLVIGDFAVIDTVALSYARDGDGAEEWSGSASVTDDDGKTFAAGLGFAFDGNGSLVEGFVEIERLEWSELLLFEDVRFSYVTEDDSTRWDVGGTIQLEGEATVLSGFLELEAGRATAGELVIENLRIGQIATIERLTLTAEVDGDTTTWAASIAFDNDAGTTGSGSMTWSDGRLVAAQLDLTDLKFSELFTLSDLSISLTAEEWSLSARFDNGDGANLISSALEFSDGRLVSAELNIQELSFGDLLVIDEFTLAYQNDQNGSSWRTSATVTVADRTTSFSAVFAFQSNQLQSAVVTIGQISWGEAIVMDDLTFTFDRTVNGTRWSLDGAIEIEGETTSLGGNLEFDNGRLVDGELSISNLRVGALATIDELLLSYSADNAGSRFDADITFANGGRASGSITWADGRLDSASLDLSDLQFGQAFSMFDASMSFDNGNWTIDAFFSNDGNEVSLSGGLVFQNGRLVDGTLNIGEVRVAGFSLTDFALVLGDSVDLGGGPEAVAGVCGVTDPGGPGDVYGISANILNESGEEGTFGGRLRVDDGRVTNGVLCASNIKIGELVTIDDLLLQATTEVAGDRVRETWSGSVDVADPSSPDDPFGGSFEWVLRDGSTDSVEITASELRFSDLLTFENVSFSYSRPPGVNRWAVAAELQRPNGNPGVSGFVELDGQRVVSAELTIANVSFGNALSLNDLTMTYVGRRAETSRPAQVFDNDGVFTSIPVGGCNEIPDGSNVPSGPPSLTGAEAYFRINAEVGVGASAVAAAGSIGLVDGRMSMFDVSIACLNLGDWLSLEDVRIGQSDQGDYLFQAANGGATEANQRVTGRIEMNDGRVAGGRLTAQNLSLGFVEVRELKVTLGQQEDGTSTWGATVSVNDPDGGTSFAGGGSVQLADGKVIGGSINLPDLPLLDVLPIDDVSLGMERLDNGNLRVSGAATIVGPDGAAAGSINLLLVWSDGTLVAGVLTASEVELFDVIDGSSLSIVYARNAPGGPRWSGSMSTRVPGQSSSRIQMGFDVINGRLDSGIIGFDGDGDGEVDPTFFGNPPAIGSGELAGFPLRAFHIQYCSADTNAAFCADVDGPEWDGRLKVQLPSDNAPSLDAAVTIRNGRFVRAAIDLDLNPGVMIFSGVFLDSIGATLELDPRLRFCGSAGLSVGSPTIPIAQIEGGFEFSEGFDGIASSPRSCDEPPVPFNVPVGTEADYYRFLIEAEAELFPNNLLGIDLTGTGYLDLWTSGYLGLGASVNASFWGNKIVVNGEITGSVFDAVPGATNPKNGQPLTGAQAQLTASAGVTVLGATASASFIVNTIGWSGCARTGVFGTQVGVSGYWDGGFRLSCGLDRVLLVAPGGPNLAAAPQTVAGVRGVQTRRADLVAVGANMDTVFDVRVGEEVLGILMRSSNGTPNTLVISPDGTVYDVSSDFGDEGPLTFTDGTEQIFVIGNPVPGTWTVRQAPGSPTVEAVEAYLGLPDAAVDVNLQQNGSELSFDYTVVEIAGQSVSFVERDSNGATVNVVGRIETTDTPVATATDQDGPVLLESLGATGTTSGTISYRSNAVVEGGQFELVALVEQAGLPREEIVLVTYEVAPATPASAPTAITATASSQGATVTWEPPTDDGGRQVMAYHVSSSRGFIVAVDGDTRSIELPIPLMTPGETLEVYVQAFTSAGPGASGAASFAAASTTEAVFEQPPQPQSFVVGGGNGPVSQPEDALMVVGSVDAQGRPPVRDRPLLAQVEDLGLEVTLIDDNVATAADAADTDLVIISSSVSPRAVGSEFRDVAVPLISWEGFLFDDLGFNTRGQRRNGETATRQSVVEIVDDSHPLSAGYSGLQPVTTRNSKFSYSRPEGDPIIVGEVNGDAVIFGFDAGSAMSGDLTAPARRVGFFTNYFVPPSLNDAGRDLFAAAVGWAIGDAGVPGNSAPTVEAGADQSVSANDAVSVELDATVDDDGRPVPPGGVVTNWSSPDAGVAFGDAGDVDTTVDLPGPGTYVLTLTADDSALQSSDTVTITVVGDVPTGTQIAYVAGSTSPPPADRPIIAHLEAGGATVTVIDDDHAAKEDVSGFDLVFVSTSVVLSKVGDTFRDDEVPVITNEQFLLDDMDMARGLGSAATRNITIVDSDSPLAAGFTGDVRITTDLIPTGTANPAASADVVAEVDGKAALFAYDAGDVMIDAYAAPAARVFFPGTYRTGLNARADYFTLLDAAVVFALG